MPLRISPVTRFYYLELYVRDGFPQDELSRKERKIVAELQRGEDKRLLEKRHGVSKAVWNTFAAISYPANKQVFSAEAAMKAFAHVKAKDPTKCQ